MGGGDNLKVLSVRQPWAWALIHGGKDIENRSWSTKYRGRVAIHASKGMTRKEYSDFIDYIAEQHMKGKMTLTNVPGFTELERGKIIGTVELVDVVTVSNSPWFFGEYGWVVKDPRPCEPILHKGSLGLRDFDQRFGVS